VDSDLGPELGMVAGQGGMMAVGHGELGGLPGMGALAGMGGMGELGGLGGGIGGLGGGGLRGLGGLGMPSNEQQQQQEEEANEVGTGGGAGAGAGAGAGSDEGSAHVGQALMKQIEMQTQLHEQLMAQRKLQQAIEAGPRSPTELSYHFTSPPPAVFRVVLTTTRIVPACHLEGASFASVSSLASLRSFGKSVRSTPKQSRCTWYTLGAVIILTNHSTENHQHKCLRK